MSVFDSRAYDDHECVVFCRDADAGLRAIIAIHDTTLGPAAGGCRMRPYASDAEALTDVLRLSRAMTYPRPFTARGGFEGLRAAVEHKLGRRVLRTISSRSRSMARCCRHEVCSTHRIFS